MAAASSIANSSACANMAESVGWMYCKMEQTDFHVRNWLPVKTFHVGNFSYDSNLDSLSVLVEYVNSNDGFIKSWICRLDLLIVDMFLFDKTKHFSSWTRISYLADDPHLIFQSIKTFEHKLKQCLQIFWTWWSHKNVGISKSNCCSQCQAKSRRLASSSSFRVLQKKAIMLNYDRKQATVPYQQSLRL